MLPIARPGIGRAESEGCAMKRFKYDYYDVEVPGDCADSIRDLGRIAITEAENRTRLYCLPALWYVVRIVGVVGIG